MLVAGIIQAHGFDGLLLATLMAGTILVVAGWLRLGGFIRLVPDPVILGFTAAIAIIIFASQLHDLLGVTVAGKEPAELLPKLMTIAAALPTTNLAAVALSVATIAIIVGCRRFAPRARGLAGGGRDRLRCGMGAVLAGRDHRHALRRHPVRPARPGLARLHRREGADAASFGAGDRLPGGVESLLSAMVADGMAGRRHRADAELVAQGFANMGSALFGGICVTGTIARTATNVRSGAASPISGMLHAVFLLAFMVAAAPLAKHIPLAALAGVLAMVCWNMADRAEVAATLKRFDLAALILATTFLLTIIVDLMVGIAGGCAVAILASVWRRRAA